MNKKLFIIIFTTFLLSIIPIVHTYMQTKGNWQGIVPSFVNDDLYYYARMENIMHGYSLIGNPYFFEHRQDLSPAFFAPDLLAVIPMKLGMPFIATVAFNFIFWSILFTILIYWLFKDYGLSGKVSVIGSILTYMSSYVLILRPVSMQIVAPFFLLFCLALGKWLKAEKPSRTQNLFLIFATASSFYIYTYLWQVTGAVLGLTILLLIYNKDWSKLKNLFVVCLGSGILALPAVAFTLKQVSSSYYWESMSRIGLVNTHLPTALSFYDGGIIFAFIFLWTLSFLWIKNLKDNREYKNVFIFVVLTGLALIVALFSNVITGKELEISNHIERFVVIWIPIALILYIWFLVKIRLDLYQLPYYKRAVIALLFALMFSVFIKFLIRGFDVSGVVHADTLSQQAYAEPLLWLNKNTPKESVVWSNGGIGYFLPIQTFDFQLFNGLGGLHLVSNKEVEERYLVSHYFDNLSLSDIEKDFREYAGVGNSVHQYKTYNRKVKICNLLHLSVFGIFCGQETDAITFKGEKYFVDLYNQYKNDIKPNITNELKKFNVGYILKDKKVDDTFARGIFLTQNFYGVIIVLKFI